MKRPINYNTKQCEAVLAYISSLGGSHVTAAQIVEHFENEEIAISRTTIYRNLEKLTQSGKLRKYNIDEVSGACFQYVDKNIECHEHFHLKCDSCGELLHLQCETLDGIKSTFLTVTILKLIL
jgi:Fur family ferric uptake transcriptional regulator